MEDFHRLKLPKENTMTLGKKIKLLCEIRQKTQKDLAKFLKVSPSTITRWVQEKAKPDYEQLWYISIFLKVNIVNLYGVDSSYETLLSAYEKGLIKITDMDL